MAHKDKKNKTSFDIGNKAAEKWTKKVATELFIGIIENAQEDDDVLCLQDAYLQCSIYGSTFHYLIEKFPVLEKFKNDIQDVIISRINKNALKNKFNSTASIWRMKQLGETDKQEIKQKTEHTFKGDPFEQMRKNAEIE